MGYDVEFIKVDVPPGTTFPVPAERASELITKRQPLAEGDRLRQVLLDTKGCKPGPEDSIDYMGQPMSYARLFVRPDAVYVENNSSVRDLLQLHARLAGVCFPLLILDLQSRQLHDAESYRQWLSRPL